MAAIGSHALCGRVRAGGEAHEGAPSRRFPSPSTARATPSRRTAAGRNARGRRLSPLSPLRRRESEPIRPAPACRWPARKRARARRAAATSAASRRRRARRGPLPTRGHAPHSLMSCSASACAAPLMDMAFGPGGWRAEEGQGGRVGGGGGLPRARSGRCSPSRPSSPRHADLQRANAARQGAQPNVLVVKPATPTTVNSRKNGPLTSAPRARAV